MKKAYRIGIDGTVTEFDNTGLDSIYDAIGCSLIDAVRIQRGQCLYIDDEGLFAKPVIRNSVATMLVRFSMEIDCATKEEVAAYQIVGNAVLVGTTPDGEDAEPDAELVKLVKVMGGMHEQALVKEARLAGFDTVAEMFAACGAV